MKTLFPGKSLSSCFSISPATISVFDIPVTQSCEASFPHMDSPMHVTRIFIHQVNIHAARDVASAARELGTMSKNNLEVRPYNNWGINSICHLSSLGFCVRRACYLKTICILWLHTQNDSFTLL